MMSATEPRLPPMPLWPSGAINTEKVHEWGLQCFEAGRQQGMTQERALHGLAASSREIEAGHQWQDIETAPKDGTHVLLFRLGWADAYAICFWRETYEEWANGSAIFIDPTHWMTLPEPPKA